MKRIADHFIFNLLFIASTVVNGQSNLIWTAPGKDFHDAIPLGNGDIGMSVWSNSAGELQFYISKTDAYDDNDRLLKLGRITVRITPNPFLKGDPYQQQLKLRSGELDIAAGRGAHALGLRVWIDANNPVIHVDIEARNKFNIVVQLENPRRSKRIITDTAFSDPFAHSTDGSKSIIPALQYPDSIVKTQEGRIVWFHHNEHSCWGSSLVTQGLHEMSKVEQDPLQNRIFGASIHGIGLINHDDTTLVSQHSDTFQHLRIMVQTQYSSTSSAWLSHIRKEEQMQEVQNKQAPGVAVKKHRDWWKAFWDRSWVSIHSTGDTGLLITRGYALQRWLAACGGRGREWIKFNGSIFTLPWENTDIDYRRWGGASWFQNVRLVYWPMIAAGDNDLLAPFYATYLKALPLAIERAHQYYHHEGAFFPETLYAWGTNANGDYGYDRTQLPLGLVTNPYVRYYWSGGLELTAMMLEEYFVTKSPLFLIDTLMPLAANILQFYDRHWKLDNEGKIFFNPAQSLETFQSGVVNPTPEIAGLKYILTLLLSISSPLITGQDRTNWIRILAELPSIPSRKQGDSIYLLPAESYGPISNAENPELYAVFPYRIYGIGKPSIQTALNSFAVRQFKANSCWSQDAIQAACLGAGRQAAGGVYARMSHWNANFAFPAMWGPNNDEIPDMDHGGAGQLALQYMLMQSDHKHIFLFPAWPKSWDVSFKLHAPEGTIIEGVLQSGKITHLKVSPLSNLKKVVIMPLQ